MLMTQVKSYEQLMLVEKVGVPYCNKSKMEKGTRCDMKVVFGPNQRKSRMLGSANVEHYFERSKS